MEIRVEGGIPVGRLRKTWLENVEADMTDFDIGGSDIHNKKKCRRYVMTRKSNPIGKWTINR